MSNKIQLNFSPYSDINTVDILEEFCIIDNCGISQRRQFLNEMVIFKFNFQWIEKTTIVTTRLFLQTALEYTTKYYQARWR